MRIKTFHGTTMQEAMQQVRDALGDDAVILQSKPAPGGKDKGFVVMAGLDKEAVADEAEAKTIAESPARPLFKEAPTPKKPATVTKPKASPSGQGVLPSLEKLLKAHGTPANLTQGVLNPLMPVKLPAGENTAAMQKALTSLLDVSFEFAGLPLEFGRAIMLVGPQGAGKTLCISKLATQMKMKKKPVTMISADYRRAGAEEQLEAICKILNVELHSAHNRTTLLSLVKKHQEEGVVLVDGAGVNPYNAADMQELADLLKSGNIEPILVLPAGMDVQEAAYAARAFAVLPHLKRMIATKLDMARRYGSVLAALQGSSTALSAISESEKVVDPMPAASAQKFAQLLLQYHIES